MPASSVVSLADTAKLGLFEGVAFEAMRMRTVAPIIFLEERATPVTEQADSPAKGQNCHNRRLRHEQRGPLIAWGDR
jgi:hypothetical protein